MLLYASTLKPTRKVLRKDSSRGHFGSELSHTMSPEESMIYNIKTHIIRRIAYFQTQHSQQGSYETRVALGQIFWKGSL